MKVPQLVSPVDNTTPAKLVRTIAAQKVIKACAEQIKLDVSRYFEGTDTLYLMECPRTGYRFYYPFSTAGSSKFYEETQDPSKDNFYRKWGYDYQFAFDRISEDERVLDIGCGTGEFLKKIGDKTRYARGLELNKIAYEKSRASGLDTYNQTSLEHLAEHREYYDTVCFFQVLEHVHDVKNFLESSIALLKPGGKLFIGVPNNEPYIARFDIYQAGNLPPHHMGLWNIEVFKKIQEIFGLRLVDSAYDEKLKWSADAYYRAKYWLDINEPYEKHGTLTKLKLYPFIALASSSSLLKHFKGGINGSFMVVQFEKLKA